MAEFGVVVDTNVLYGMPVADTLLLAGYYRLYKLYWSGDIMRELERTMLKRGHTYAQVQRRLKAMTGAFRENEVADYESYIPLITLKDPDDRHVVAVALREKAELIVTYNLKHFPKRHLSTFSHKMQAKSPDEFLCDLLDMYRAYMVSVLQHQAQRINHTLDDLLVVLENDVPRFVADVRLFLEEREAQLPALPMPEDERTAIINLHTHKRRKR